MHSEKRQKRRRTGIIILAVICITVALATFLTGCDNIRTAAGKGDVEAVKAFLEKGVNVNERSGDGETALHWAAKYGRTNVMHYLLQQGADVREKGTGCGRPLRRKR